MMFERQMCTDLWAGVCRVLLVLLELLVLLDFRDLLVCPVLEEIVVPLVALALWYVRMHQSVPLTKENLWAKS